MVAYGTPSASKAAPAWMPSKAPERGKAGRLGAGLGKGSQALRKRHHGAVILRGHQRQQSRGNSRICSTSAQWQVRLESRPVAPLAPCAYPAPAATRAGVGFGGSGFASTPTDTAALAYIQCKAFKGAGGRSALGVSTAGDLSPLILWLRWRCQREGGSELWAKPSLTQRGSWGWSLPGTVCRRSVSRSHRVCRAGVAAQKPRS